MDDKPTFGEILSIKPDFRRQALFTALINKKTALVLQILESYPETAVAYDDCKIGDQYDTFANGYYAIEWAAALNLWDCVAAFVQVLQQNPSFTFENHKVQHNNYGFTLNKEMSQPLHPLLSVLIMAASGKESSIAISLLPFNLDIEVVFYKAGVLSRKLLAIVLKNNDVELAANLLRLGASINNINQSSPCFQAAWKLNQSRCQDLPINHATRKMYSQFDLNIAITTNDKPTTDAILQSKPFFIELAIFQAIAQSNTEMAIHILENFPQAAVAFDWGIKSPHFKLGQSGYFAIEWAAGNKLWSCVESFLKALENNPHLQFPDKPVISNNKCAYTWDANQNEPVDPFTAALIMAIEEKTTKTACLLLDAGANPVLPFYKNGEEGFVWLQRAIDNHDEKLVGKLLYHGAQHNNPSYQKNLTYQTGWKLCMRSREKTRNNLIFFTVLLARTNHKNFNLLVDDNVILIFQCIDPDFVKADIERINARIKVIKSSSTQEITCQNKLHPAVINDTLYLNRIAICSFIKQASHDYIHIKRSIFSSQSVQNDTIQGLEKKWCSLISHNQILSALLDIHITYINYKKTKNTFLSATGDFGVFLNKVKKELLVNYPEISALAQVFYNYVDHAEFLSIQAEKTQLFIESIYACQSGEELLHWFDFFEKELKKCTDYRTEPGISFYLAFSESLQIYKQNLLDSFNEDAGFFVTPQ